MNVELLQRTRDAILANAEAFDIHRWGWEENNRKISCNSPACISGWAVHLAGGPMEDRGHGEWPQYLDLTKTQEMDLFYLYRWPMQFRKEFWSAPDKQAVARVAAARIDHFVATEGRE